MHPFKGQAKDGKAMAKSRYSGGGSVKSLPNLSMNGAYKDVKGSTGNLQQHKDQNAAPGMKRGGRLDKVSRSKKSKTARDMVQAKPPLPEEMIASQAGADVISPASAPAPFAKGGAVKAKYPLKKGGAESGVGRLEMAKSAKH